MMMNPNVSKIHFVNTTGVSLNDRFTNMSKTHVAYDTVETPRPRSNSTTRSDANRLLIDHWDRSLALQAAIKASASIRPARPRLQRNTLAQQLKRTMGKLPGGVRRLQRSNSFTDIATMNADRVQLMQRARGRTPSITSRLGAVRTVTRGRSTSRGRSASRTRSTSRGRQRSLSRSNSQTNLQRAGSRTNLSRAGSRNGLNTISRKPIAPNDARRRLNRNNLLTNRLGNKGVATVARGRSRSRSRVQAASAPAAPAAANGRARSRSRKRAGSKARASSVNSRLGANRTSEPVAARVNAGRVTKRSRSGRRGVAKATAVATRAGRAVKREAPKRKGAGGKQATVAKNGNGTNAAAASGRRGRSRSRRANSRVRGRSASKNRSGHVKQDPKSREQLDNELDQYMANTKSSLDREMDQYMHGIGSSM